MATDDARSHKLGFVALKQWRKLVKTSTSRSSPRDNIKVSYSQLGLNRIDIDWLQKLGLKQFACTGDLVPWNITISIRKEAMRRVIGRVKGQGLGGLHECALFETQVIVNAREA